MGLVASVGIAALASVVLTLAVRAAARPLGLIVPPRQDRWHTTPTATAGGIAIYVAFVVTYVLLGARSVEADAVLFMASFVFMVGLVDDFVRLKPYTKLVFQFAAAGGVVFIGLRLPWTAYEPLNDLITLFWLVAITNAVNLLDNMDGLAAGISIIGCLFLTINFLLSGQVAEASLPAVLGGAILGFLVF